MFRLAIAAALLLATTACGRRATSSPDAGPRVETARRVPVTLVLERTTVAATDETLPFTLRLTNPERVPVRIDFTGDPLFPRGPRDKVPVPALWLTIDRDDRPSSAASVSRPFATRDTVLAAGETMEVPVQHALRELGVNPGPHRMRAGIGSLASAWVTFTVTP